MQRYILFVLLFVSSLGFAQQDLSLHFMHNIAQSNFTNPSSFNRYKVNVSLPSFYSGFYHSAFTPADVVDIQGTTMFVSLDDMVNQLKEEGNILQTNLHFDPIAISFMLPKLQFSLNYGVRVNSHIQYPKGLFSLLWEGNGTNLGETINIAPSFDIMAFHEIGLGVAVEIQENLSVGGRLRYLSGIATTYTDASEVSIHTNPEFYQLTATTNYRQLASGITYDNGNGVDFGGLSALFGSNTGMAIDLGATYRLLDQKLKLQASILDLGAITWDDNLNAWESQGSFTFEGLDLKDVLEEDGEDFENLGDTLQQVFNIEEVSTSSFKTSLGGKYYLSGIFTPVKGLHLGALLYGESYRGSLYPAFALSAKKDLGKIFSAGLVYSMREKAFTNLGANLMLRLGGVQLFALTDNLIPIFNPLNTQNFNFRVGLNVAVGKKEKKVN